MPILKAQACPETAGFGIRNLGASLRQPRLAQATEAAWLAVHVVSGEMPLLLANGNNSNKCNFCLLMRIFLILIYVAAEKRIWVLSAESPSTAEYITDFG